MFTSQIAGLNIRFLNKYKSLFRANQEYLTNDMNYDILISVSDNDINLEQSKSSVIHSRGYYEYICACRQLCFELARFDAFLFHSAFFKVDNRGIAFTAHSGVGKTTQVMLWKELLKDRMEIINGDKPIVRYIGDKFVGYGAPWCGKEHYGRNSEALLTDICFIERSSNNYVERLDETECINLIMDQVFIPSEYNAAENVLKLISKMLNKCNLWKIYCTKEKEAALVAYNTIVGNKI